jgi:hypothetical protein
VFHHQPLLVQDHALLRRACAVLIRARGFSLLGRLTRLTLGLDIQVRMASDPATVVPVLSRHQQLEVTVYPHSPGFVYEKARHCAPSQTIEISVPPRCGSSPVCSGGHGPAPAYDYLRLRRVEFVPLWGCMVVFLYCMRRVAPLLRLLAKLIWGCDPTRRQALRSALPARAGPNRRMAISALCRVPALTRPVAYLASG